MTEPSQLSDDIRETMSRLYDNPDTRIDRLSDLDPDAALVSRQTAVFKALASEDRLRILAALRECECCVCELQIVLDAPQSTVATHLQKLRKAGLIKSRKKGRWSYYRIADTAVFELLDLAAAVEADT